MSRSMRHHVTSLHKLKPMMVGTAVLRISAWWKTEHFTLETSIYSSIRPSVPIHPLPSIHLLTISLHSSTHLCSSIHSSPTIHPPSFIDRSIYPSTSIQLSIYHISTYPPIHLSPSIHPSICLHPSFYHLTHTYNHSKAHQWIHTFQSSICPRTNLSTKPSTSIQ